MKNRLLFKLIMIILAILLIVLLSRNYIDINQYQAKILPKLAVNSSTWDSNRVTPYTDSNGVVVPIPKGYTVSSVSSENVASKGLVIYEGTSSVTSAPTSGSSVSSSAQVTRNQWVWVPVSNISRIYEEVNGVKRSKLYSYSTSGRTAYTNSNYEPYANISDNEYYLSRYGWQGFSREKFEQKLQVEYEETIKSIEKYGGFYIGRYEVGNVKQKVPVVKRMNTDIVSEKWYTVYNSIGALGANPNVKTNLIWGCLFDETLQWLVDTSNKTYSQIGSSASWGNYYDASFTYTTSTSGSTSTKSSSRSTRIPTGSTEYSKANNIYDLAGNVWEWTLEGWAGNRRRCRGGDYSGGLGSQYPAGSRSDDLPSGEVVIIGFRAYMYIK